MERRISKEAEARIRAKIEAKKLELAQANERAKNAQLMFAASSGEYLRREFKLFTLSAKAKGNVQLMWRVH